MQLAWKLAETGGCQLKKFFFTPQPGGDGARCQGYAIPQTFGLVQRDAGYVYTFLTQARADRFL